MVAAIVCSTVVKTENKNNVQPGAVATQYDIR